MKYIQNTKLLVFSILLLSSAINLWGQCDLELQEKIEKEIKEDKVTFLKKFSADLGPGEDLSAYSFVLSKRTWYRFYFYESNKTDGKGHFEIADDTRILGTTKNPQNDNNFHYFDFKCNKTKIYHIKIKKNSGEDYCAEVVLAHVKDLKDEEKISKMQSDLEPDASNVFFIVEQMPQFIDGDNTDVSFKKWISDHLVYPEEAKKTGIQGRVFVSFIVSLNGEIENVQIVRGVDPILDNYVLELIKKAPKWSHPGYQDGIPVIVKFTFPVIFNL